MMKEELKHFFKQNEYIYYDGCDHIKISDMIDEFFDQYYQPERSKREDVILDELIEKVIFARCEAEIHGKLIQTDLLTEILHYLISRCGALNSMET